MPLVRKRRAEAQPSPPPAAQRARSSEARSPATSRAASSTAQGDNDNDNDADADGDGDFSATSQAQMVKKLVRLALASEHSRQPIRRSDVSTKVLGPESARAFKEVFAAAQEQLRHVFGMQLVELPAKERVTIQQKRAAQRADSGGSKKKRGEAAAGEDGAGAGAQGAQSQGSANKVWVLGSALHPAFKKREILPTAKAPSLQVEAAYVGLCGFVVAVIYLSDGARVSERKLEAYLKTCNVGDTVLARERTDVVLKRMERQGYVVKIKERDGAGGEETVDYVVGPRGKVEFGEKGVAGLVRSVYGKTGNEMEDLEDRLETSLGVGSFRRKSKRQGDREDAGAEGAGEGQVMAAEAESSRAQAAQPRQKERAGQTNVRRSTRGRPAESEEEEESAEDDEEEDGGEDDDDDDDGDDDEDEE